VIKATRIRCAAYIARMEGKGNAQNILFRKSEGKRPLGRTRRRLEDNIRMDHREMRWEVVNWIWVRVGILGGPL
jgi:hypothetical protein